MYSHTRKVGSLGRYGPRVGRKLRDEALKVEIDSALAAKCPTCSRGRVKRNAPGIWECKTCGYKFTGGTHIAKVKSKAVEEQ